MSSQRMKDPMRAIHPVKTPSGFPEGPGCQKTISWEVSEGEAL